jgi:hypothetical protein
MSTLSAGSFLGSLFIGILLRNLGRRSCMILSDVLGIIGALLTT